MAPEPVWTTWGRDNFLLYRDSNYDPSVVQPVASRYTDWDTAVWKVLLRNPNKWESDAFWQKILRKAVIQKELFDEYYDCDNATTTATTTNNNNSWSAAIKLQSVRPRNWVSISGWRKRFFPSSRHPDRLWAHPTTRIADIYCSFTADITAGAWSLSLTYIKYRGWEWWSYTSPHHMLSLLGARLIKPRDTSSVRKLAD
jgi:hypothetical protein